MQNLTVQVEHDYNKFKFLDGKNREPNERQINILMASIKELDLTMARPIMTHDWRILDGQHRFLACRNLNLPIYYLPLENLSEAEVYKALHLLNSNAKNWQSKDYINLYSSLSETNPDFEDYDYLKWFINEYKVSPSIAVYFLTNFNKYKSAIDDDFKDGKFKIESEDIRNTAVLVASDYKEIRDRIIKGYRKDLKTRFVKGPNFIFAFSILCREDNYNQDSMLASLSIDMDKEIPMLVHCDSVQTYYKMLAQIHNVRSKDKVREDLIIVEDTLEDYEE